MAKTGPCGGKKNRIDFKAILDSQRKCKSDHKFKF